MPTFMSAREWLESPQSGESVVIGDDAVMVLLAVESAITSGATKASILARTSGLELSDPATRAARSVALYAATVFCPREATERELSRAMGFLVDAVAGVQQNHYLLWNVVLLCEMARPLAVSLREHGSLTALIDLSRALESLANRIQTDTTPRHLADHRAAWVRSVATWMEWEWAQTMDSDRGPKLLRAAIAALRDALAALEAASASVQAPPPPTDRLELQYRLVQAEQELHSLESPSSLVASVEWRDIVEGYLAAGSAANAGAAAGMWLQSAFRTAPGLNLLSTDTIASIEQWIRDGVNEPGSDFGNRIKLQQILTRLLVERAEFGQAELLVRDGTASGAELLRTCGDVVLQSNLRSVLEDWVGLALLIDLSHGDRAPGALYSLAQEAIRGDKPYLVPAGDGSAITVLIHRWVTAAGRGGDNGHVVWTRGAFAEQAWAPLTGLLRLSKRDLRATRADAPPDDYSKPDDWFRLFRQQAERLGFRKEGAAGQEITILSDRSDIPLQALINAGVLESPDYPSRRARGVVALRTNLTGPVLSPPEQADPVIFVSAFADDDLMRDHLRTMYVTLRHDEWEWAEPSSLEDFRQVLGRRAKGFVVGIHGLVKDMLAPGVVEIGTDKVDSGQLLETVELGCAPFVVLVSCFAASGFRDALGGGTSLVDQFLGRGASVVLGSPFPVFMDGAYVVAHSMNTLLRRIDRQPLPLDPGVVATEAAEMVERVRARKLPPRFWAGFTSWSTPPQRPP